LAAAAPSIVSFILFSAIFRAVFADAVTDIFNLSADASASVRTFSTVALASAAALVARARTAATISETFMLRQQRYHNQR